MSEKVVVKNLYKIFGPNPQEAFPLLEEGLGKEEIFEKTGLTVGVEDADFTVQEGEIFVVMGLSGSGKSTLVRMLNRIIEPTSGQVLVDGQDVAHMSRDKLIRMRRHDMSMVFQSFALMPHLTVLDNAAFGLDIAGDYPQKDRKEKAMQALEQVGLKANANSFPSELSGGMQQRVGLARALARNPTVMLMDEAFSALDPLIRSEMQDELLKLQADSKRTVIFISHDLDEAMRIGDRIAIMDSGKIVQVGTPDDILKNPANDYVQSFFRGVDATTVLNAGDIARDDFPKFSTPYAEDVSSILKKLRREEFRFGYVLDADQRYKGVVSVASLEQASEKGFTKPEDAFLPGVSPVTEDTELQRVLYLVRKYEAPVPVVDENGVYLGVISKNTFLRTIERET